MVISLKGRSIGNNALLNILKNSLNILFPLITFPYISRVLGPEGIGEVDYILSITAYFTLISTFGIPIYGVRELARIRDDKKMLNKVSNELFIISLITTVITYLLFIALVLTVPQFEGKTLFFLVAGFLILFNTLGIEWLYEAMEDYLIITIRSILIKFVSLVLIFTLVRTSEDNLTYLSIIVFATVGANIFNLLLAKKYVRFRLSWSDLSLARHIKPLGIIFISTVVSSIYMGMDVIILGTLTSDFELVGYYSASVKINRIAITILASVSIVIVPRVSYYVKHGEKEKYESLLQRVLDINLQFALPLAAFLIIFSNEIIYVISGPEYGPAAITMRIITPMILTAAVTNILYNHVLIPQKKEKVILLASLVGGVLCIGLNLLLVPLYQQNGTAIATLVTELAVMLVELAFVFAFFRKFLFSVSQKNSLFSTFLLIILLLTLKWLISSPFILIGVSLISSVLLYFGVLLLLKDHNIHYFIERFESILKRWKSK